MSAYTPPDKIEIYAAALQSDINSERFQQVVDSKLKTYWIGTVYAAAWLQSEATNSRRPRRPGTTLRILWIGARKLSVRAPVAHKERAMLKLALQQRISPACRAPTNSRAGMSTSEKSRQCKRAAWESHHDHQCVPCA